MGFGVCTRCCRRAQASKLSCGALPSNGVVRGPRSGRGRDPLAVYTLSYAKANGCPVALAADNLACQDCVVGSSLDTSTWHCNSRVTSRGVAIGAEQLARVAWTVTATDQAGGQATADCAVCVEQARRGERGREAYRGRCPDPFTPTTPCQAGSL